MKPHEDIPSEKPETTNDPTFDSLEDEPDQEYEERRGVILVEKGRELAGSLNSRQVIVTAVVASAVAAAVIGAKVAYDRRRSTKGYAKALHQIEDAKDALLSAAADLPEQSRAVLHRVTRR